MDRKKSITACRTTKDDGEDGSDDVLHVRHGEDVLSFESINRFAAFREFMCRRVMSAEHF